MEHLEPVRMYRIAVGAKIREFRTMFGISRTLLADTANMSRSYLYRLEVGDRGMSAHTLSRIILAARNIMKAINWNRRYEYEKWMYELIEIIGPYEEGTIIVLDDYQGEDGDYIDWTYDVKVPLSQVMINKWLSGSTESTGVWDGRDAIKMDVEKELGGKRWPEGVHSKITIKVRLVESADLDGPSKAIIDGVTMGMGTDDNLTDWILLVRDRSPGAPYARVWVESMVPAEWEEYVPSDEAWVFMPGSNVPVMNKKPIVRKIRG